MPRPKCCPHDDLLPALSPHALDIGFDTPSPGQRAAATTTHGQPQLARAQDIEPGDPAVFPAPVVLPDDCLSIDPKYPPQSLRSFKALNYRNANEPGRRVIYFAAAPGTAADARFVREWARVNPEARPDDRSSSEVLRDAPEAMFDDVCEYLKAFYHGMEVKRYDGNLQFVNAEPLPKAKAISKTRTRAA